MAATELPNCLQGRLYASQQVHYLSLPFTAKTIGEGRQVGILPKQALVLQVLIVINKVLQGKKISIGKSLGGKDYGETADANVGIKEVKPAANAVWWPDDEEVRVYAKTDTAAQEGEGIIVITFIPNQ